MSATLSIYDSENSVNILYLVQIAINAEINRLQFAIQTAKQRLSIYETKYQVSSEHFIETMTAEDLMGGDDEYIMWAGEFKLYQKLLEKHKALREIYYVAR